MCRIIPLCCLICFPKTFYSRDISDSIINELNDHFLKHISSNHDIFDRDRWTANISRNKKKILNLLSNKIYQSIKKNKIKVFNITGHFTNYLQLQLAHYIFQSLIFDPIIDDINNINELPFLDIPINSVIFNIPDPEDTEKIILFINRLKQFKEKQVNFNQKISGMDKTLLNIKFELEVETAINKLDFNILIRNIYKDYQEKDFLEKKKLENFIENNM